MAASSGSDQFQGVVCCCIGHESDSNKPDTQEYYSPIQNTIIKLLDLERTSSIHNNNDIACHNLYLKNKYYQATVHLFDYDLLAEDKKTTELLESCHAIILHGNGQRLTTEQLDQRVDKLNSVGGEPRVLLCEGIDEECEPYKTLIGWSVKNGYDLILTGEEDAKTQLIDSLSAYRWTNRIPAASQSDTGNVQSGNSEPRLEDDMMKKLVDFDNLLGMLSAYRERPELRGNPDDKNIEQIAELLSGLLGDDVDSFLDNDEDAPSEDAPSGPEGAAATVGSDDSQNHKQNHDGKVQPPTCQLERQD